MQKNKNTLKENFQTMYSLTDANIMRCLFLRCSFDLLSRQIHLCQKKGIAGRAGHTVLSWETLRTESVRSTTLPL